MYKKFDLEEALNGKPVIIMDNGKPCRDEGDAKFYFEEAKIHNYTDVGIKPYTELTFVQRPCSYRSIIGVTPDGKSTATDLYLAMAPEEPAAPNKAYMVNLSPFEMDLAVLYIQKDLEQENEFIAQLKERGLTDVIEQMLRNQGSRVKLLTKLRTIRDIQQ